MSVTINKSHETSLREHNARVTHNASIRGERFDAHASADPAWDDEGEPRRGIVRDVAAAAAGVALSGGAAAVVHNGIRMFANAANATKLLAMANPAAMSAAATMAMTSLIAFAAKKRFVHEDDGFLKKLWISLPVVLAWPVFVLAKPRPPLIAAAGEPSRDLERKSEPRGR